MKLKGLDNFPQTLATIEQKLLDFRIKPTSQRIDIAKVMLSKPQHLSAEQVLYRVNSKSKHVSRATVYNTLGLFVEKGLIRQVLIEPEKVFYDSNTAAHFHFYNEDTGAVSDFNSDTINRGFESILPLPENTVQSGLDVIIRIKNSQ